MSSTGRRTGCISARATEDRMQRRTLLASLAASALLTPTARAAAGFIATRDNQRLAFIDQRDLSQVTLVGHSMGAGEVARYLARYGSRRVARTLLVAPKTPFALKTADNPDGTDRAVYDRLVAALEADPRAYLAAGAPGFFGRGAEPELVEWGLSIALQASVPAVVRCLRAFSETDFRADMVAFTMPT